MFTLKGISLKKENITLYVNLNAVNTCETVL